MRVIKTGRASFPEVAFNVPLSVEPLKERQVLCGDQGKWRVEYHSPKATSLEEVKHLERRDCPSFVLLMRGRVVLLLGEEQDGGAPGDGGSEVSRRNAPMETRELKLRPGKPVLLNAPFAAYCPDGPQAGLVLMVTRDSFRADHVPRSQWRAPGEETPQDFQ